MTDMHPHWHSTGDDDPIPSFPAPTGTPVRVSITPASRMPAAVIGIALFGLIGVTYFGGWDAITAQVGGSLSSGSAASQQSSNAPVEVRIAAANGFDPQTVTVRPGQQIIWINEQSIPHILTSQTLRDGSGGYLNTPAIFPTARATFTVGPREPARQHTITSTTDQSLVGTVIVSVSGVSASTSSRAQPFGNLDGVALPTGGQGTPGGPTAQSSSVSSAPVVAGSTSSAALPGSTAAPVYSTDDSGQPLGEFAPVESVNPLIPAANVFAPATPIPNHQPDTGPGLWVVGFISVAVLWQMTRKYFRMA